MLGLYAQTSLLVKVTDPFENCIQNICGYMEDESDIEPREDISLVKARRLGQMRSRAVELTLLGHLPPLTFVGEYISKELTTVSFHDQQTMLIPRCNYVSQTFSRRS